MYDEQKLSGEECACPCCGQRFFIGKQVDLHGELTELRAADGKYYCSDECAERRA